MRKLYNEPEFNLRIYPVSAEVIFTTSNPESNEGNDLNTDDEYDYFG